MSYLFDISDLHEEATPTTKRRGQTKEKKLSKKQLKREALREKNRQELLIAKQTLSAGDWVKNKVGKVSQIFSIEEKPNGYLEVWVRYFGTKGLSPEYAGSLSKIDPPKEEIIIDVLGESLIDESVVVEVAKVLEESKYHEKEYEQSDDDSIALDIDMNFHRFDEVVDPD